MITRKTDPVLKAVSRQFKAVAITGPRQSGKIGLTDISGHFSIDRMFDSTLSIHQEAIDHD